MRNATTLLMMSVLVLAATGVARGDWTGAATVRDESFYVPSSDLTLGAYTNTHSNARAEGYVIANPFQINLEYQAGILEADIANINTYLYPANAAFPPGHSDGTWTKNYSDNDQYILTVDCDGGAPVYTYGEQDPVIDPTIDWALTSWGQTILAGDIVSETGGVYLRVQPAGTYRPFVADPPVNDVEVFDGTLACEVLGYHVCGTCSGIGEGSALTAELVPEPASMSLLALGGLGVLIRRRRRK